jgi:hypothetical protein
MLMFVVSRPLSQRRSCSIQQQQNPDTPIAVHRSLRRLAACVRRRILSAQICTTVQPYRIRVSVSAVRCLVIRSVDPRSARFRPDRRCRAAGCAGQFHRPHYRPKPVSVYYSCYSCCCRPVLLLAACWRAPNRAAAGSQLHTLFLLCLIKSP